MNLWLIGLIVSVVILLIILIKKFQKKWIKCLLIFASLCLVFFTAYHYIFPLTPAPQPIGDSEVLTDTVYYSHPSDFPEMLTSDQEREIPVSLWYPRDLGEQKHPLLLFSHGAFGIASSNETMFLELASRGYIVMSLHHPHHSFKTTLSNGKSVMVDFTFIRNVMTSQGSEDLEGTLYSLNTWLDIRLEDINFVLDRLLDDEKDNEYEGYIDQNRIVLSGHSLGGSAALAIGRERSEEISALVILESPFVKDIVGVEGDEYIFTEEEYPLPILHFYSDSLYEKVDDITTYSMNARTMKSKDPKFTTVHISGVGHLGLTDMALATPMITNFIDGGLNKRRAPETLLEINGHVVEFLDKYNN